MGPSKFLRYGLAMLLATGFYLGLSSVLALRLEVGDAYPRYSTYRSDPQGLRALYESLDSLPDMEVTRNERRLTLLPADSPYTLFFVGAVPGPDPKPIIDHLETLIEGGGRLVVAFQSQSFRLTEASESREKGSADDEDEEISTEDAAPEEAPATDDETDAVEDEEGDDETTDDSPDDDIDRMKLLQNLVDIEELWGFKVEYFSLSPDSGSLRNLRDRVRDELPTAVFADEQAPTPMLPWRSAQFFSELDEALSVLYHYETGEAAIIERPLGNGSVILMADSFCLSNESLMDTAIAPFLAYLVGPYRQVVFDEWGKGLSKDPWIIDLLRRYRLEGVLLALVLTGLLVVWRSALPLPPRPNRETQAAATEYRQGREAQAGLVALLERHIPLNALPEVWYQEWESAFRKDRRYSPEFRARLKALLSKPSTPTKTPLDRYKAAMALIEERNHHRD